MLREELRLQTRSYHDSLELSLAITETIQTQNDYIQLLERYYGYYKPIEENLIEFGQALEVRNLDIQLRLKTNKLELDLLALGKTSKDLSRIPLCSQLPSLSNYSRTVGCLYVLEESTLGGQILARHFREKLQIQSPAGLNFILGYGSDTGKMWQSFERWFESCQDVGYVRKAE